MVLRKVFLLKSQRLQQKKLCMRRFTGLRILREKHDTP
jgi:hypothetical protein